MSTRSAAGGLVAGVLALFGCGSDPSAQPVAMAPTPAGARGSDSPGPGGSGEAAPPRGVATPGSSEMPNVQTPPGGIEAAANGSSRGGAGGTPAIDAGVDTSLAPDAGPSGPARVFLAGDSIVQTYPDTASDRDQAGWGQMLAAYFDAEVDIENRAVGGRTARRYIDEGLLDTLSAELSPGDYLLVEFGTNDGNRTATYDLGDGPVPYFLDPATDFKTYLQRYVDAALERGARPVFVTPTPRNSAYCTGGNGTGAHATAMRELGLALGVPVVDLNARSVAYLQAICPAPSPEDFFLLRADGTIDGTHFQENGARILAGFVADGLVELGLLREHRRAD